MYWVQLYSKVTKSGSVLPLKAWSECLPWDMNVTQAKSVHFSFSSISLISETGELNALYIHIHRCVLVHHPAAEGYICVELTICRSI